MEDAVEAEAVEIDGEGNEVPGDAPNPEAAMVAVPATPGGVIAPLDVQQVVDSMQAYQELLPQLLDSSDYQDAGRGKRFVKKSGWRKIAKAFGLSTEIVNQRIERDGDGSPVRATVVVRALHGPTGQYSDGDGHCSVSEDRFSGPRGNKSKLENDLTATATTRAKNRAISDLVGMGDVSAEEMDVRSGPPFGPDSDKDDKERASGALVYLVGPDAESVWGNIKQACGGYMPKIIAETLHAVAEARKAAEEAEDE